MCLKISSVYNTAVSVLTITRLPLRLPSVFLFFFLVCLHKLFSVFSRIKNLEGFYKTIRNDPDKMIDVCSDDISVGSAEIIRLLTKAMGQRVQLLCQCDTEELTVCFTVFCQCSSVFKYGTYRWFPESYSVILMILYYAEVINAHMHFNTTLGRK